jgi:hypothetical protein
MALELAVLLADAAAVDDALALGDGEIFLMDDGVRVANDPRLADREVVVCATDAERLGVTLPDHVRAGSQYDHAVMVRDAARFVAFAGGAIDDNRPGHKKNRMVRVRLERKVAQGLRAAVGYCGVDLRVTIVGAPRVLEVLDPTSQRALAMLRGLARVVEEDDRPADVEVTW